MYRKTEKLIFLVDRNAINPYKVWQPKFKLSGDRVDWCNIVPIIHNTWRMSVVLRDEFYVR